MKKRFYVEYKITAGKGEVQRLGGSPSDELEIYFGEGVTGFLTVGKHVYPVEEGHAVISLRGLCGALYPVLTAGGKKIKLEPIRVDAFGAAAPILDEDAVLDLRMRLDALEKAAGNLNKRLKEAESKIGKTRIF